MKNEFLRHTLSTIKYRFDLSVATSQEGFATFSLGSGSRSPLEIINHMFHVLSSTRTFLEEEKVQSKQQDTLAFTQEIERFHRELILVDNALAANELPINYAKRLLQGPLADILTHIGQIAMLQRVHGTPIPGEDFSAVSIETGLG